MAADDNFSPEHIGQARERALGAIKNWLYEDIELVVRDNGNILRHNIADFDSTLKSMANKLLQQNALSRSHVIDFFLEQSEATLRMDDPRSVRENIMCISQFAEALGIRQEMEQVKRRRIESKDIRNP